MKVVNYFNPFQWIMIFTMFFINYITGGFADPVLAAATATGVICVVMVGKGAIGNYAFGFINAAAYGFIAYKSGVYGDAIENFCFFLPTQIIGYFMWKNRMNNRTRTVRARVMTVKQWFISGGIIAVCTFGFAQILNMMGGKVVYYDSATNVLTFFAQILMLFCFAEQWIAWIAVNVMSVITWIILWTQGDPNAPAVTAMWSTYLINAIYGYYNWRKLAKN